MLNSLVEHGGGDGGYRHGGPLFKALRELCYIK